LIFALEALALDVKSLALGAKSGIVLKGCGLDPCLLSNECLDAVISEKHYQNILQVVEAEWKKMPSLCKNKGQAEAYE